MLRDRHASVCSAPWADTVINVSPSIFDRLVAGQAQAQREEEAPASDAAESEVQDQQGLVAGPVDSAASFRDVVSEWRTDLAGRMRAELENNPLTELDLKTPHPGGLAQLYAERPTKLSNLFRDRDHLDRAQAEALDLLRQAQRLLNEYGLVTLYLSIGTASWQEDGQRRTSPVLLRPVDVSMDQDGEIYLALRPGMEISNRLLMVLSQYGTALDATEILHAVRTEHGFSPEVALKLVREAGADVPGFSVSDSLTVGVFSHSTSALLRELGAPQWLSLSTPVRSLAGDKQATKELAFQISEPNPLDRDPWEEKGIGEQSPEWADVVEAATGENSVLVRVPGADSPAPLVAALAAEHAAAGKSVLVVASPGPIQNAIAAELANADLDGVFNVVGSTMRSAEQVQRNLLAALEDALDDHDYDASDRMRTRLRRRREELENYTDALHRPFPDLGVSAFDALQALTDLTSLSAAPATKVRLDRAALRHVASDRGSSAKALLARAYELGMFSGDVQRNWWTGIEISDEKTFEQVLAAVQELSERILPQTERDMASVQMTTGLRLAPNVAVWQEELGLLGGVQKCLDVLEPRVFERSAADMAVATASKDWRKERGISLRGSKRRSLVKQAKDLLVPGAYAQDLHAELAKVQQLRERWRSFAEEGSWPSVPTDLPAMQATDKELTARLASINPYIEPVYGNVFEMSIEELGGLLDALAGDPEGARELPERVRVSAELEQMGLGPLMADFLERQVAGEALNWELDLAWWATALSVMLAEEPDLGGTDPTGLQDSLQELRVLEQEQIASLGPIIRSKIMRLRQAALAEVTGVYDEIYAQIATPMAGPAYYAQIPLTWGLTPIVITSPAVVPQVVPWGRNIDVVIMAGIGSTPPPALVPIIARGSQVIVAVNQSEAGDTVDWLSRTFTALELPARPRHINSAVVSLVSKYGVESGAVSIPGRVPQARLNLQVVHGTGMPAPGVHAIESSAAEVEAVVGRVREHAHADSDQSLAVVALNDRHATRIRAALRSASTSDRVLREFLERSNSEPFVVLGPHEAADYSRDRVILAVGFAKTPHGRVIHDFGNYSLPGGEALLGQALRVARGQLDLVASFAPGEVDREKLRQPGAQMLVDLLELGGDGAETEPEWPTLEMAPDHLLVDLAERLYGLGLNVVPNLGVQGGLRVPLGIGHPEVPGELLVAILTDDDRYIEEPSLRVRDHMVPRLLEDLGWKVRIELSMAVFIDPNKEAEAIVQLVLDAVDEFYENNPALRPDGFDPEEERDDVFRGLGELEEPEDIDHSLYGVPTVADAEDADVSADSSVTLPMAGRPLIAAGLPLAAYGDDQLDAVAQWVISVTEDLTEDQMVEGMREFLGLLRPGAQSDAVLRNVVRRNQPAQPEEAPEEDGDE